MGIKMNNQGTELIYKLYMYQSVKTDKLLAQNSKKYGVKNNFLHDQKSKEYLIFDFKSKLKGRIYIHLNTSRIRSGSVVSFFISSMLATVQIGMN